MRKFTKGLIASALTLAAIVGPSASAQAYTQEQDIVAATVNGVIRDSNWVFSVYGPPNGVSTVWSGGVQPIDSTGAIQRMDWAFRDINGNNICTFVATGSFRNASHTCGSVAVRIVVMSIDVENDGAGKGTIYQYVNPNAGHQFTYNMRAY